MRETKSQIKKRLVSRMANGAVLWRFGGMARTFEFSYHVISRA